MTRSRRRRSVVTLVLLAVVVGVAVVWGPGLAHRYGDRLFSSQSCTVEIDGEVSTLTAEQANSAAIIVATAIRRNLPVQAATIALAAALQESDLRNLDVGDRDSRGLFQQRPSQGWGTVDQVEDPHYATNAFYDALLRVEGWEGLSVTDAAQAVQRSAFPHAYADHESPAVLWATALEGAAGIDSITCSLGGPSSQAEAPMLDRLREDFGDLYSAEVGSEESGHVSVVLRGPDEHYVAALTAWLVVVSSEFSVESIRGASLEWSRERASWAVSESGSPEAAGDVVVVLSSG
jgi:hypothetical protein